MRRVPGAVLGVLGMLTGCTGGKFASELPARPQPTELPDNRPLRLPQDAKFSILLAPSQRAPGLGGQAQADSRVQADGQAQAHAWVEGDGKANATFQIGHALRNPMQRQMDADVLLRCRYEYETRVDPQARRPEVNVGLRLYARDGRNRLVQNDALLEHSTELGGASQKQSTERRFTLTLAPGETVAVFLGGQVDVHVAHGTRAEGTLRLESLEMEIHPRLAPPVQTATDGRR